VSRIVWILALTACVEASPCTEGSTRCSDGAFEACGPGGLVTLATCEGTCDPERGCIACVPETITCDGDVAVRCRADGSGTDEERCDPDTGTSCDPRFGCVGPCAPATLGDTYVGCDYYPVVMGNPVPEAFSFAVVVASASAEVAHVVVDGGGLAAPERFEVAPGAAEVRRLPWQRELKLCSGPTFMTECDPPSTGDVLAVRGAYHLRADRPIVVYQFNPLEYRIEAGGGLHDSYSADASLLLPTNAWGHRYLAVSQRAFGRWPGELVVVAREATEVRITPTASTLDAPAGATTTFLLGAGDALELLAPFEDLTGSLVEADRPVEVLSGHFATNVPLAHDAADHLEESMLPITALGTRYVVVPAPPAIPRLADAGRTEVQIVAADAEVDLIFDPPVPGARSHLAGLGDSVVLHAIDVPLAIEATGRILVAQSIVGGATYGPTGDEVELAGDPAMSIAVPIEQFRTDYLVHAPVSYASNFAALITPAGAVVELDGIPIDVPEIPVGATELTARRVALRGGDGNHRLHAEVPFGVLVYGFGSWTSYFYPGGLDVRTLEPE
jgi:hypothetical protein